MRVMGCSVWRGGLRVAALFVKPNIQQFERMGKRNFHFIELNKRLTGLNLGKKAGFEEASRPHFS